MSIGFVEPESFSPEEVLEVFFEVGTRREVYESLGYSLSAKTVERPWRECQRRGWIEYGGRGCVVTRDGLKVLMERGVVQEDVLESGADKGEGVVCCECGGVIG